MKIPKKVLSLLLCCAMSFTVLPADHAHAAQTAKTIEATAKASQKAAQAAEKKIGYKMVVEKVTYNEGKKERGIISFEYPVLKGDSDGIFSVNEQIQKIASDYFASESAANFKENTIDAIADGRFSEYDDSYYYETSCSVTYNKDNIIGLYMTYRWNAGGVTNQGDFGYAFDVSTGKQLAITDVIKGTPKQVKNKILKAAKKYYTDGEGSKYISWAEAAPIIKKIPLKDFKFYVEPKNVVVCFESYDLGTNFWDSFKVDGIYK